MFIKAGLSESNIQEEGLVLNLVVLACALSL